MRHDKLLEKISKMTYEERLQYFSEGRVTTQKQLWVSGKDVLAGFSGMVSGIPVSYYGNIIFQTEQEARLVAKRFRENCRLELSGLK